MSQLTKYYCKGCNQIINREYDFMFLESWCATAGKKITLHRVSPKCLEIYNLLLKLSHL